MEILNTSYFRAVAGSYTLSPFDLNGNIIPQITIECDSTAGAITIDLFEIGMLTGKRRFSLIVVDVASQASTNNITINSIGSDLINESGNTSLVIDTDDSGVILHPISQTIWLSLNSTSGGGGVATLVVPVTTVALDALIAGSTLVPGVTYHDTDKNIWFKALSSNELSKSADRSMRVVKSTYYSPAGNILGVWYPTLPSAVIGDLVVYGGKVWQNVNGNVGASIDLVTLDAEWLPFVKSNNTYYEDKLFSISYDYNNSWVEKQFDNNGNEIGCPFSLQSAMPFSENPCDITDWNSIEFVENRAYCILNNRSRVNFNNCNMIIGNYSSSINFSSIYSNNMVGDESQILDNDVDNISHNSVEEILENTGIIQLSRNRNIGGINYNSNIQEISHNTNSSSIQYNSGGFLELSSNSNNGAIEQNTVTSPSATISFNSNNGAITGNTCPNGISHNKNIGAIVYNAVNDRIWYNSNSGVIEFCNVNGQIYLNCNNGAISGLTIVTANVRENSNNGDISTSTPGDITDPLVNK